MKILNKSLIVVLFISLSSSSNLDAQLGPLRQRAAFFGRQLMNRMHQRGGMPAVRRLWQTPQWKKLSQFWKPRVARKQAPFRKTPLVPVVPKRGFSTSSYKQTGAPSGRVPSVIGSKKPNLSAIGVIGGAAVIAGYEYGKKYSATEEYLKVVGFDKVGRKLGISSEVIAHLKKMVEEKLIPMEKKHADDYYVFYHTQDQSFLIVENFLKMLYERNNKGRVYDFEFLRRKIALYKNANVKDFLNKNKDVNDNLRHISEILLAVNTSFPGVTEKGESSFSYYVSSRSVGPPDFTRLFFNIIRDYFPKMDKETAVFFAIELGDIQKELKDKQFKYGILLQIFIPKEIVGKYVYNAAAYGKQQDIPQVKIRRVYSFVRWLHNRLRFKDEKLISLLNSIQTDPGSVDKLTNLQMRILLDEELFGNPDSGVKIYRYHEIPDPFVKKYNDNMLKLSVKFINYYKDGRKIHLNYDQKKLVGEKIKSIEEDERLGDIEKLLSEDNLTGEDVRNIVENIEDSIKENNFDGLEFLSDLVSRGKAISEAKTIVMRFIGDEGRQEYVLGVLSSLVKKGELISEAKNIVKRFADYYDDPSLESDDIAGVPLGIFDVLEALVIKDEFVFEVNDIVSDLIFIDDDGDEFIHERSLHVLLKLIERGVAITEDVIVKVIEIALSSSDEYLRRIASGFLLKLVASERGNREKVEKIANKNDSAEVRKKALGILSEKNENNLD